MLRFFGDTHINFLGQRKLAYMISAGVIAIGLLSIVLHGGFKYGVDFQGGTLLQVRFEKPIEAQRIRETLAGIGIKDAEIQHFGEEREAIIRVRKAVEGVDVATPIIEALNAANPDNRAEVRRQEMVGPKVGSELRRQAVFAVLYAMVGILIYCWFRFEFKFSVGAVVALFHDVTITLGMISLTGREITLPIIAALLTIVGYSINDTIVVYDRIRENRRKMYGKSFVDIVNASVNETLSRTIITSLTVFLVVLALYFFGGEVIRDFSFALLVGVIVGTYSSIYIASALAVDWMLRTDLRKKGHERERGTRAVAA
jgi:preprotein translocase subunit SecF